MFCLTRRMPTAFLRRVIDCSFLLLRTYALCKFIRVGINDCLFCWTRPTKGAAFRREVTEKTHGETRRRRLSCRIEKDLSGCPSRKRYSRLSSPYWSHPMFIKCVRVKRFFLSDNSFSVEMVLISHNHSENRFHLKRF